MSLLFKNLKRRLQGKEPVVNTTGVTREEIEDEEDTAPKAIDLDARPPAPPTTDEIADDLIQNAMTQHTPRPRQRVAQRSKSNPSGPVQIRTSYDKKALSRLASELENMGRGCDPNILKELRSHEDRISSDVMKSLGHQTVAMADVVIVAVKSAGSLNGPPMVLKNRLAMDSGFEIGMAGKLMHNIAEEHAPVEIEVVRDPTRTVYLIDLDGDRDKDWADMKAQQASRVEVEKYVLVKGVPQWDSDLLKRPGYEHPIVRVLRGPADGRTFVPGMILAEISATDTNTILSIKMRKCDLPLDLTVVVDMDPDTVFPQPMTFCRQGTFPDNDKISRVVVDLNAKSPDGKQPAIDEDFITETAKAFEGWDGEMEEVDLSEHSHSLSISAAGGPVFSSSMMPASVISSFQSATVIPNTRSQVADAAIQPGAMMSSSVIKDYTSERSLEISEAVTEQALAKSQKKIEALERKVKKLETQVTGGNYLSRARGGTTGV